MEDVKGVTMFEVIWVSLGFIHGRWVGGCGWMLKAHQCPRMVGISQCCLKGVRGCNMHSDSGCDSCPDSLTTQTETL